MDILNEYFEYRNVKSDNYLSPLVSDMNWFFNKKIKEDNDKILVSCDKYVKFLTEMGIEESIRESDNPDSLKHIRWMCEEIPNLISVGKIQKANRWLGFVQGVFWTKKLMNIEDLKNDNR